MNRIKQKESETYVGKCTVDITPAMYCSLLGLTSGHELLTCDVCQQEF